jgi:cytochrome c553
MILDLDATAAGGTRLAGRWFSAFDPHTTSRRARTCASCHRSAQALGLGEGELLWSDQGPQFTPAHSDGSGLAADGWTRLGAAEPGQGTRAGLRSLRAGEMQQVLRVGACLACHDGKEQRIFADFSRSRQQIRQPASPCTGRRQAWLIAE